MPSSRPSLRRSTRAATITLLALSSTSIITSAYAESDNFKSPSESQSSSNNNRTFRSIFSTFLTNLRSKTIDKVTTSLSSLHRKSRSLQQDNDSDDPATSKLRQIEYDRIMSDEKRLLLGVGEKLEVKLWGNPVMGSSWTVTSSDSGSCLHPVSSSSSEATSSSSTANFQPDNILQPNLGGKWIFHFTTDQCCEANLNFVYDEDIGFGKNLGVTVSGFMSKTESEFGVGNAENRDEAEEDGTMSQIKDPKTGKVVQYSGEIDLSIKVVPSIESMKFGNGCELVKPKEEEGWFV